MNVTHDDVEMICEAISRLTDAVLAVGVAVTMADPTCALSEAEAAAMVIERWRAVR